MTAYILFRSETTSFFHPSKQITSTIEITACNRVASEVESSSFPTDDVVGTLNSFCGISDSSVLFIEPSTVAVKQEIVELSRTKCKCSGGWQTYLEQ